jgi:hypothetical protein
MKPLVHPEVSAIRRLRNEEGRFGMQKKLREQNFRIAEDGSFCGIHVTSPHRRRETEVKPRK